ncbi:3-deoxy-manno-octulosonate cytidylyltransferase [Candidatus Rubidus massiliensis]|nr:MAG: hypothetical protein BGO10_00830 [Chlamydia sp. 32-24]CDZ81480.1 3-deoxy-manno-octulosonate cytidylyltransferase [Candidatus Rubidus massiliensis]
MNTNVKVLAVIPARYASTRFHAKLLAPIHGIPLIQRTYENAKQCSFIDECLVTTDHETIASLIRSLGGQIVMTSPECANGTERVVEALKQYPPANDFDIILNIQGDVPNLEPEVMEKVINVLKTDDAAVMSTAIMPITDLAEAQMNSVVKCVTDLNGNALYFSRSLIPGSKSELSGQYFKHIGIYAFKRDFIYKYASLPATPLQTTEDLEQLKVLEHGYKIKTVLVNSVSVGVDIPEDIQKVERMLCNQNK